MTIQRGHSSYRQTDRRTDGDATIPGVILLLILDQGMQFLCSFCLVVISCMVCSWDFLSFGCVRRSVVRFRADYCHTLSFGPVPSDDLRDVLLRYAPSMVKQLATMKTTRMSTMMLLMMMAAAMMMMMLVKIPLMQF